MVKAPRMPKTPKVKSPVMTTIWTSGTGTSYTERWNVVPGQTVTRTAKSSGAFTETARRASDVATYVTRKSRKTIASGEPAGPIRRL